MEKIQFNKYIKTDRLKLTEYIPPFDELERGDAGQTRLSREVDRSSTVPFSSSNNPSFCSFGVGQISPFSSKIRPSLTARSTDGFVITMLRFSVLRLSDGSDSLSQLSLRFESDDEPRWAIEAPKPSSGDRPVGSLGSPVSALISKKNQ